MSETTYTVLFPFCGLGGGALGFVDARPKMFGKTVRFVSVGGIDNDPDACKDFVALTKSPALCADIASLTPERLREFAGERAPDVVFLSAPCVGSSKLISDAKAAEPKYAELNMLGEVWIDLMLRTWPEGPRLVLFENVPNVVSPKRGGKMIGRVKKKLARAGYVLHDGNHECGELGGLAQRRKRWLMVARNTKRVPPLLYAPRPSSTPRTACTSSPTGARARSSAASAPPRAPTSSRRSGRSARSCPPASRARRGYRERRSVALAASSVRHEVMR